MASLPSAAPLARPADGVWQTVSDAAGICAWSPVVEHATAVDGTRGCTLVDGRAQVMGPLIGGGVLGLKAPLEDGR